MSLSLVGNISGNFSLLAGGAYFAKYFEKSGFAPKDVPETVVESKAVQQERRRSAIIHAFQMLGSPPEKQ